MRAIAHGLPLASARGLSCLLRSVKPPTALLSRTRANPPSNRRNRPNDWYTLHILQHCSKSQIFSTPFLHTSKLHKPVSRLKPSNWTSMKKKTTQHLSSDLYNARHHPPLTSPWTLPTHWLHVPLDPLHHHLGDVSVTSTFLELLTVIE